MLIRQQTVLCVSDGQMRTPFLTKPLMTFLYILGCTSWLRVTLKIVKGFHDHRHSAKVMEYQIRLESHEFNEIFCKSHASQSDFFMSMLLQ